MSFWERPCAAKSDVRLARPDVGGGMLLLAPLKLAVLESLPPSCISCSCRFSLMHLSSSKLKLIQRIYYTTRAG